MYEEFEFTTHARIRMDERGITKEEVRRAFKVATIEIPGTRQGTRKIFAEFEDKCLCVVFETKSASRCKVISVWWR